MPPPSLFFVCIWIGWALSWAAAAFWSSRAETRLPVSGAWPYRLAITAGAILLWHRTGRLVGATRLWHVGYDGAYLLAALALLGILFAWWGRLHLGALWSGAVTRKADHRIVDTGPYAVVRHPIYTGLIVATVATAAAEANLTAIAGAALIAFGLWLKARIEERFLAAELGPRDYAAYRSRVPMLLPFIPTA